MFKRCARSLLMLAVTAVGALMLGGCVYHGHGGGWEHGGHHHANHHHGHHGGHHHR